MKPFLKTINLVLLLSISYSVFSKQNSQNQKQISLLPSEVGKRIVSYISEKRFGWRYQKVCTYYGALVFGETIEDKNIKEKMINGFEPYFKGKRKPHSGHVDYNVFGIWPFELYRQTGEKRYLEIALKLANDEYNKLQEDGLTYLSRFWVDDMYMVGSLQVQAYKSTGDKVYLDRAALLLKTYSERLQRSNGLFHHRKDAPFYWGRGNGWAAAAFTELLQVLPESHPQFISIIAAYKKMMNTLLQMQGNDGMWHQLLDDPASYPETSCTGMFLFAMATGLEKGWLPLNIYVEPVKKSWNALAGYVNEKGAVKDVCVGTNAKNKKKHYLTRPRSTGNFHGQAAVLWAATAMFRLQPDS